MKKLQSLKRNFEVLNEEATMSVKGGFKKPGHGGTPPPPDYNGMGCGSGFPFIAPPPPPIIP